MGRGEDFQQREPDPIDFSDLADHIRRTDHHGERLLIAMLPTPQTPHSRIFTGIAQQLISAEPLDRDDPSISDRSGDLLGIMTDPWPTARAGNCFGVEATARRIGIVCCAGRAHREASHRGGTAVIGQPLGDGVARAAMGAIDERIEMEAARRIKQLAQTLRTGRGIGGDPGRDLALLTDADVELVAFGDADRLHGNLVYPSQWRFFQRQRIDKIGGAVALDLDHHATGIIGNEAAEPIARGEAVDVGTKAHALHGAAHMQAQPCSVSRHGLAAHADPDKAISVGFICAIRLRIQA